MYGVIRRYRLAEGAQIADLMQRVQRGFVPILAQVPGFVAYHVVDLGDGGLVSVSVFEGQDAAEDSTRRAADWVQQELASLIAGPPQVEQGPVGAHATKEPGDVPHLESGQPV